jgi:hypothetical protein
MPKSWCLRECRHCVEMKLRGWGDPRERDADAVREDVVAGLVSVERARDVYGVAICQQ